jgi:GntR family transcriptional regulator
MRFVLDEKVLLNNIKTVNHMLDKMRIVFILYISVIKRGERLKIVVSNRSSLPIYEQIKAQIKEAVFSGELKEDDVLPSIRQLARDLKISVITTTRAYSDLEQEGFVVNVQGKGCFVLPQNKELARENALRRVEEGLSAAIAAAASGGIEKPEVLEMLEVLYQEENHA